MNEQTLKEMAFPIYAAGFEAAYSGNFGGLASAFEDWWENQMKEYRKLADMSKSRDA